MVAMEIIEAQLKKAGCYFRFWGRAELRELGNIIMEGETIQQCVNGHYAGGFAMLCVTNCRLLLIDKKPMYLTLEDIRFDMIAELNPSRQLLESTLRIVTPNRQLVFRSWSDKRLRMLLIYTQQQMMEVRQHFNARQFQQAHETLQGIGGLAYVQPAAPKPITQEVHVRANIWELTPVLSRIIAGVAILSCTLLVGHVAGAKTINPYFLIWAALWSGGILLVATISAASFIIPKKIVTQTYDSLYLQGSLSPNPYNRHTKQKNAHRHATS